MAKNLKVEVFFPVNWPEKDDSRPDMEKAKQQNLSWNLVERRRHPAKAS